MTSTMTPYAYILAVRDMNASADYFRDVLGFSVLWEDDSDWRLVERHSVRVMLGNCPGDAAAAEIGSHGWFGYIEVTDVAELYSEITARGAVCSPPADRAYGMREIVVTTIDGHRIVFGQMLTRPNSG